MTDRYVGPGGADGNNGLTWANRKLTLNGVEDTPVVAGDTVYVGPGVYREALTVDVSGTSGNPISYIGDVSGENTDSVGGIVRITGSNDDQSAARSEGIFMSAKDWRTFRGFMLDTCTSECMDIRDCDNNIFEDLWIENGVDGVNITNTSVSNTFRRIYFRCGGDDQCLHFNASTTQDNTGNLVENCIFNPGGGAYGVAISRMGGITVKNSVMISCEFGIRVITALSVGQQTIVNNNILAFCNSALQATVTGEIVEDYNTFYGNSTDRTNTDTGGNSITYPPLFNPPIMLDGIIYPWQFGELSEWSQIARIAGTGESTDDLFGVARPTVSAKKSWGAIQLREAERETGTVQTGSAALTLADAGDHQIYVPITATSTTFEVAARYESEYAGTLPRLIIRQPGQADQVDTMVAAADTWETLSLTFTPNATPPYVVIIFRSLNTSVTGSFDTYWDDLDVS